MLCCPDEARGGPSPSCQLSLLNLPSPNILDGVPGSLMVRGSERAPGTAQPVWAPVASGSSQPSLVMAEGDIARERSAPRAPEVS